MEQVNLLLVGKKNADSDLISKNLSRNGYEIFKRTSSNRALTLLEKKEIHIVLFFIDAHLNSDFEICRKIRKIYYNKPIQIVFIAELKDDKLYEKFLECGGDDFLNKPLDPLEIQARVKAALIRLKKQMSLYQERDFFKNAVFQEEQLSSKILDQNLYLKRAFQDISKQNIELKRVKKELEKIAMYDTLSGLLNRMSLFNRIDIEIERAMRAMFPLSGIMLDIDHFKPINDNFGHQCGDIVIREIGNRLRSQLRKYDYAGRYGGEEFFIILPNTNLTQAFSIGERFRKEIANSSFQCGDEDIKITVSLGIAQYRASEVREKWIERADKAMYLAKQDGRNRVRME